MKNLKACTKEYQDLVRKALIKTLFLVQLKRSSWGIVFGLKNKIPCTRTNELSAKQEKMRMEIGQPLRQ